MMRPEKPAVLAGPLLGVLLLAACGAVRPAETLEAEEEVIDEVEQLLLTQAEAWNAGDLIGFTSLYEDDCVFLSPTGLTRGRDQVLARYRDRYPDRAAMGQLSFEFIEMIPMTMELEALLGVVTSEAVAGITVAAHWYLHREGGEDSSGLTLIVLRRDEDGDWRIVQDASM